MATKVLIIKLGHSETLDPEIGRVPSLGDVLRTTPILWALKEKYTDSHITWLVSRNAEQLLSGNNLINRLLVWDEFVPFQIMREKFDVLINLEKVPGICALTDMIDAWVKYGFRFDSINGIYHGYEKGLDFISYIEEKVRTKTSSGYWQQILIEMIGVKWKQQEYIIGYKPETEEVFDVGLNYRVGSKWPTKEFPMEMWTIVEKRLQDLNYSVSWQKGLSNLYEYIDWINSCRLIISNDSLGLHLAFALKKKAIGLFGSTSSDEVFFYGDSKYLRSRQSCIHMPCYMAKCITGLNCMSNINLDEIIGTAQQFLGKQSTKTDRDIILQVK